MVTAAIRKDGNVAKSTMMGRNLRSGLLHWVFPALFIVLWQLAVEWGYIDHQFFPAPISLAKTAWVDIASGKLAVDSIASLGRVIAGLTIGVVVGVTFGLSMAVWRPVDMMFGVTIQILRSIPPIAWIGFSIIWFGIGSRPAIFLISLGVVFPMLISAYQGVRQVDLIYVRAAYNLGAGNWMFFKDIILPAALPSVLTGLRVSVGLAWILMVVGELVAVSTGLGATLIRAQDYNQIDRMLAYMLVIGFYGYLSDLGVASVTRYLLRWQRRVED